MLESIGIRVLPEAQNLSLCYKRWISSSCIFATRCCRFVTINSGLSKCQSLNYQKIYKFRLQRFRDQKIRVCVMSSISFRDMTLGTIPLKLPCCKVVSDKLYLRSSTYQTKHFQGFRVNINKNLMELKVH